MTDWIQAIPNQAFWATAAGDRWQLARALARVESELNPWVAGDAGNARGLWQLHEEFARQWAPAMVGMFRRSDIQAAAKLIWIEFIVLARGEPWVAAAIMRVFFDAHQRAGDLELSIIFHYGHVPPSDPDGYWKRVQHALEAA